MFRAISFPLLEPALPAIALGLAVSPHQAKYVLAVLTAGFLLAKLFIIVYNAYAPARKITLLLLPLAMVGAFIAMFSSIISVLIGSLLLGIGVGTASTLASVLLREERRPNITREITRMLFFSGMTPIVALLVSGYLVEYVGWRYNYLALLIFGIVAYGAICFSQPDTFRKHVSGEHFILQLRSIIKNHAYIAVLGIQMFYLSISSAFSIVLPFLAIRHYHMPAHVYAGLLILSYIAALVGNVTFYRLGHRLSAAGVFFIVLASCFFSIVFLYCAFYFSISITTVVILGPVLFYLGQGMLFPYVSSRLVKLFPQMLTATAVSFCGVASTMMTMIIAFITAHIDDTSTESLAIITTILFLLTATFCTLYVVSGRSLGGRPER